MQYQKLFRYRFIEDLKKKLAKNRNTNLYLGDHFEYSPEEVLLNEEIAVPKSITLIMPEKGKRDKHDFENAKIIHEAYKGLNHTQASDVRIWTFMSHVTFWDYMKKRCPVEEQPLEKRGEYILEHWFINGLNPRTLLRHNIALLWWGAHLTYDDKREDPYELTRELFSMLDYTRTLLPSVQGRNNIFSRALLEYVIENKSLFNRAKETRVRHLMKKLNYRGGYKLLPPLAKKDIKIIFDSYKSEISKIKGRDTK